MLSLPFHIIHKIEQLLDPIPIEDLVLVFSQKEEERYLLVFNNEVLPPLPHSDFKAKLLSDLKSDDYAAYDGPVVGFSALDVIFPDIPTHGVNFYLIHRIFERQGKEDKYRETAFRLAKWLMTKQNKFVEKQRGYSKVIELALPKLLTGCQIENLIAVLPHEDLNLYLSGQEYSFKALHTENLDELSVLETPRWIVTIDQAKLFNPNLGRSKSDFIDLNIILRQMGRTESLCNTYFSLARICQQEWEKTRNQTLKEAAIALAVEAQLMSEDVEDLIAIIPHQDFEHFVKTGDAVRIYRIHSIAMNFPTEGYRYSMRDLVDKKILLERMKEYNTIPFSFSALSPAFEWLTSEPIVDLGPIMYSAGRETELARTFMLLSADLLKYTEVTTTLRAKSEDITALALRSAAIYNLSDPWHQQWHARYNLMVKLVYSHLDECLQNQVHRATDYMRVDYYRALRDWHGCATSQDIPRSLDTTLNACRDFLRNTKRRSDVTIERHHAEQLVEVIERLTTHLVRAQTHPLNNLPVHFDVRSYLRQIADTQASISLFSRNFNTLLEAYENCHRQWQRIQDNLSSVRPSEDELSNLLATFALVRRAIYAPAHESKILHWVFQQDMERIEQLRQALGRGPIIRLQVLNPQVILERRERLSVVIENIGGSVAREFTIKLSPSQTYELISDSEQFLGSLNLRHPYHLEWDIRPKTYPFELRFSFSFLDHNKLKSRDDNILLKAIQAKTANITPHGGNPYQVGLPVSAERFFGREKELKQILNNLLGGIEQPVMLRGPRRIGKSSILFQIRHLLIHEGEAQHLGFTAEDEAALRVIHPVLTSLQEIQKTPDINFIAHWFQGIFEDICQSVGFDYDKGELSNEFNRNPYRTFEKNLDRLLSKLNEVRLLIMIDEWDEQRHLGDLGRVLRAIMQKEKRVNWIISSTWTLREEMGKFGSPFFSQVSTVELKEMDWEPASRLILHPSEKIGVDWQGDAVVALLEQTARRPYLIQAVCHEITHLLYQKSLNLVDPETVQTVISDFIVRPQATGQPFAFLWNTGATTRENNGKARLHWLGRLILHLLDSQNQVGLTYLEIKDKIRSLLQRQGLIIPEEKFYDEEFSEQMIELEHIFDVITLLEGQRFTFSIPLAQEWFHHIVSRHPDPVEEAFKGMLQDYEEWKSGSREDEND